MRSSNPFWPDDRVDTDRAGERKGDEDVFDNRNVDGDENDVADASEAFHCVTLA